MTREDIENNVGYWQEKANLEYVRQRQEHGVNNPYMIIEIYEAFDAGYDKGYQYARENLWYDAQGDNVPEYGREVIVIGRDGKVFYGHRPNPKEVTMVDGKPYHAKTYDKNGWNWPDIALWLDVEIPHELMDKIETNTAISASIVGKMYNNLCGISDKENPQCKADIGQKIIQMSSNNTAAMLENMADIRKAQEHQRRSENGKSYKHND